MMDRFRKFQSGYLVTVILVHIFAILHCIKYYDYTTTEHLHFPIERIQKIQEMTLLMLDMRIYFFLKKSISL